MIDCERAGRAIASRLAGELDAESLRELADHLKHCGDCAGDARVLDDAIGALRDDEVADPGPVYWASFGRRLRQRIANARSRSRRRIAALVTAAAALATVVALQVMRVGGPTPPDQNPPVKDATMLTANEEMERLQRILERTSATSRGRSVLRAVLEDLVPADPLELDEVLHGLTPEESAILGRELSGLEG